MSKIHPLIQQHIPLHDKNWFKTGGPARYFCQPTTADEVRQACAFAQEKQIPLFILGSGANILISDEGFPGMVIRPALRDCCVINTTESECLVRAGAGLSLNALIEFCLDHNLCGLEEFSGIPGTVGGSVFINLHYFEFLLDQFLVEATVLNNISGEMFTVDRAWFKFGYNQSTLQQSPYFLLDATFRVHHADDLKIAYAHGRRDEIIRHRTKRYPTAGTCGSFFRNFFPEEVTLEREGKKIIYIAYYLDKLGIKGALRVGGAAVSYQHANMIVNDGTATSTDIVTLAKIMQERVREAFGITPQPECQLIGFASNPLL
jgi:UDP-N-acetylmuramate dehydrogenase